MDTTLLSALHSEEHQILAQLRNSIHFRRLEEIRQLLRLYDQQPPVGAFLDTLLTAGASVGPAQTAQQPSVIALHGERASA